MYFYLEVEYFISIVESNVVLRQLVDIVTNPKGATVTVDGISQGLSPVKGLTVNEGNHIVVL